jgi:hypothetical protein
MRNLIAAAGAVLLSALGLLPAGTLPASLLTLRDPALVVLTLYLAWQGLLALRASAPATATATSSAAAPPTPSQPPRAEPPPGSEALVLLSLLQEKGRFLDFVSEDITAFNDAQVAAASRVVHQGCAAVVHDCLALSPTYAGAEGDRITIDASIDPSRYRLLGKSPGQQPFFGFVVHRGWKTTRIALPRLTRPVDPAGENVVTPMEVEVR